MTIAAVVPAKAGTDNPASAILVAARARKTAESAKLGLLKLAIGIASRPICGSFRLAMFVHAGPVCIDLLVTPEVLRITGRP